LPAFGVELRAFIAKIPEKPATDQQFADCKAACKKLQDAQDALDAAESAALAQIATFDEMRRTKALLFDLARDTRLAVEKLVAAREKTIKEDIVIGGKTAFAEHIVGLNKRLGKPYMPVVPADFAAAAKNKRTIASLQDAVDTALAKAKIEANAIADNIGVNLNTLHELAADYAFLFADTAQIVLKAPDDFTALVKMRISEHKEKEAKRIEGEAEKAREKIRLEEEAKARAKVEAERQAQAEKDRIESARIQQEGIDRAKREKEQAAARVEMPPVGPSIRPEARVAGQQAAMAPAPSAARPSDVELAEAVAEVFHVPYETAISWLSEAFGRKAA
jgi:hypothetical protein